MSADKIRPERIWIKPCDPCDRVDDYYLCDPRYLDGRETAYVRADLARPSQAGDERVARLRDVACGATTMIAHALDDGHIDEEVAGNFEALLTDLNDAIAAMNTPKGGGYE